MIKLNQRNELSFTLNGAKLRHDSLQGKKHLVVPCIMMVEGVHNGSAGPLLYPGDELRAAGPHWNHMPVVVYHPEKDGRGISARDPDVLNTRGVGLLLNTTCGKDGRQKTECWLDPERLKAVDNRVLEALEKGQMVEVSTGLFTDNEDAEEGAEWKGEPYYAIARNHRPDHLAILPDKKGSCSILDGAGLLRNQEGRGTTQEPPGGAGAKNKEESPVKVENAGKPKFSHEHKRQLVTKALVDRHKEEKPGGSQWDAPYVQDMTDSHVIHQAPGTGQLSHESYSIDDKGSKATLGGDASLVTRKSQYMDAKGNPVANLGSDLSPPTGAVLPDAKGGKPSGQSPDVDPESPEAEKEADEREKKAKDIQVKTDDSKKTDKDGAKFATTPGITNANKEMKVMDKTQLIAALIANAAALFTEADRSFLESKDEKALAALHEKLLENKESETGSGEIEQEGNKTGVKKAKSKDMPAKKKIDDEEGITKQHEVPSVEEFIDGAPAGLQEALSEMNRNHERAKARIIRKLVANKKCRFTANQLGEKKLADLEMLLDLAGGEKLQPVANYEGMGEVGDPGLVENNEVALDTPVYDFGSGK